MSKEEVIDYVMTTPGNPNRAVLTGMLDAIAEASSGGGIEHLVDGSANGSVRSVNAVEEDENYTMGDNAVALGEGNYAPIANSLVFGRFAEKLDYGCAEVVGGGTSDANRVTLRRLETNGNEVLLGDLQVRKTKTVATAEELLNSASFHRFQGTNGLSYFWRYAKVNGRAHGDYVEIMLETVVLEAGNKLSSLKFEHPSEMPLPSVPSYGVLHMVDGSPGNDKAIEASMLAQFVRNGQDTFGFNSTSQTTYTTDKSLFGHFIFVAS